MVIGLGHFSVSGAYRVELELSNDINDEILSEILDFDVHNFGRIEVSIFQALLVVLITLFFTAVLRSCGFGL